MFIRMNGHAYKVYKDDDEYYVMRRKAYKELVDGTKVQDGSPVRKLVKGGKMVKKNVSRLVKQDKNLRKKIKEMETLVNECDSDDYTCLIELDKAKIDLRFSEQQNGELIAFIQKLTNENRDLSSLTSEIQRLTDKCTADMAKSSSNLDGQIAQLRATLAERERQLVDEQTKTADCEARTAALMADAQLINTQIAKLETDKATALAEVQSGKIALEKIGKELDDIRLELNTRGDVQNDSALVTAQRDEIEELKSSLDDKMRENEAQLQQIIAQFTVKENELKDKLRILNEQIVVLEQNNGQCNVDLATCNAEKQRLGLDFDEKLKKVADLAGQCEMNSQNFETRLNAKNANINQLQAEIENLQLQLAQSQAESAIVIENLRRENRELSAKLDTQNTQQEDYKAVYAELNTLADANLDLKRELENLKQRYEELPCAQGQPAAEAENEIDNQENVQVSVPTGREENVQVSVPKGRRTSPRGRGPRTEEELVKELEMKRTQLEEQENTTVKALKQEGKKKGLQGSSNNEDLIKNEIKELEKELQKVRSK
jgi:chromosome segregation ATPase